MASQDALRLFVEVMEKQSFTAAGRSLGLDPSVVSRRIRRLEEDLDVPLFRRTTRALSPTDAAQRFYERVAPALAEIQEARLEAASPDGGLRGPLRVAAPGALGRVRVGPVVHAFVHTHPEVTLELLLSDRRLDLVREGVDIAIRVGTPSDPGQVVRRLGLSEQWLAASPEYLDRHPITESLAGHRVVLRVEGGSVIDLREHLPPHQRQNIGASFMTDDIGAAADAAKAGLGLAGLPRWLIEADVQAGHLVKLPIGPTDLRIPIYAVLVSGRRSTRRARAFVDALGSALGGT